MWNKEFWLDTAERCICTMCEVAIPLIPVSEATSMDWGHIATMVMGSGVICLLKCIVKATGTKNELGA